MLVPLLLLLVGLLILVVGADALVRGASGIALASGLSPLVVGLTIVAFGTSAPELAVSVKATLGGAGDLAIGNIIGSNIFNIAFILGLSALLHPLIVHRQVIRLDMPVMLASSVLFTLFCLSGKSLVMWEGAILFTLVIIYTVSLIRMSRRETAALAAAAGPVEGVPSEILQTSKRPLAVQVILLILGLVGLIYGARLFVDQAMTIARYLKWSEALIGLTIVAVGTSLPELATSIVAAFKKEVDMAVGNIIGSNTFNVLCIGGVTGLLGPVKTAGLELLDFGVMLGVSIVLLPLMWTGLRISRWEGVFLLAMIGAYLAMRWP